MDNLLGRFYDKVGPVATKIASQKHLLAVRDGLVLLMPFTIVSSIFIIIGELPITAYQNFMIGIFGEAAWGSFVWDIAFPATLGISAVIASFGIAYSFANNEGIDGLPAGAISVSAYFFLLNSGEGLADFLGSEGLFVCILVSLIVGEIYVRFIKKDIVIHLPDSVPPTIMRSFIALIPAIVISALFFGIRLLVAMTPFGTVHNLIQSGLQAPLMNITSTFFGTLTTTLSMSVLWSFGLHGDSIVGSVVEPILTANYLANVEAFKAGLTPEFINCEPFVAVFLNFGGTGGILGLVLAMKFCTKSKAVQKISNISLVPSLFNISEPVMFGLPIVLNPIMILPFILVTLVNTTVAYGAFAFNLVNKIIVSPPWTTPVFASGYLATGGDVRAIILQVVLLAISFALYLPFVKILDKDYLMKEQNETA